MTVFVIYISGWLMFLKPIISVIDCDAITGGMVVGLIIKIIFALPVARIIYAFGVAIGLKIFGLIHEFK